MQIIDHTLLLEKANQGQETLKAHIQNDLVFPYEIKAGSEEEGIYTEIAFSNWMTRYVFAYDGDSLVAVSPAL
jgi:hypothetical protein